MFNGIPRFLLCALFGGWMAFTQCREFVCFFVLFCFFFFCFSPSDRFIIWSVRFDRNSEQFVVTALACTCLALGSLVVFTNVTVVRFHVFSVYALLWSVGVYSNGGEFAVQLIGISLALFTAPGLGFRMHVEHRGSNLVRRTHSALRKPVAIDNVWSRIKNVFGACLFLEFVFFILTLEEFLRERSLDPGSFHFVLLGISVIMLVFHGFLVVWLTIFVRFQEKSKICRTCQECVESLDDVDKPVVAASPRSGSRLANSPSAGVDLPPGGAFQRPAGSLSKSTNLDDQLPLSPQSQPKLQRSTTPDAKSTNSDTRRSPSLHPQPQRPTTPDVKNTDSDTRRSPSLHPQPQRPTTPDVKNTDSDTRRSPSLHPQPQRPTTPDVKNTDSDTRRSPSLHPQPQRPTTPDVKNTDSDTRRSPSLHPQSQRPTTPDVKNTDSDTRRSPSLHPQPQRPTTPDVKNTDSDTQRSPLP